MEVLGRRTYWFQPKLGSPQLHYYETSFIFVINNNSYVVLQSIAVDTLIMQSYLVTADDNNRLNANLEDFEYLVTVLGEAISAKSQGWEGYAATEIIEV